ncbi:general stress protein [Heyndrickxia acidicola]|uniref:General stress protein n=1 Tax=Heyndrickxia acidicola TaxID=209389 RepID=A0ABU6MI08_9BACI|nr:general stress protein [Heyndrickxia acidicola]MED1204033.1 general stress protein [Heyndrickxia acidicola]
MTKEILGIYDSKAEAIEEINQLKSANYSKDELVVVASNQGAINTIEDSIGMDVGEQVLDTDINLFDELMAKFKGETGSESVRDNIMQLGVSQLNANRVVGLIDDGKIVLLGETEGQEVKRNGKSAHNKDVDSEHQHYIDENLLNSQNPFDLIGRGEDLSAINRSLESYERNEPTLIESGSNIEMDTSSFGSNSTIHQNKNQENNASEIQYKGKSYNPRGERDVRDLVDKGEEERKWDHS